LIHRATPTDRRREEEGERWREGEGIEGEPKEEKEGERESRYMGSIQQSFSY